MLKILQINILLIVKNNCDIYLFGYRHVRTKVESLTQKIDGFRFKKPKIMNL